MRALLRQTFLGAPLPPSAAPKLGPVGGTFPILVTPRRAASLARARVARRRSSLLSRTARPWTSVKRSDWSFAASRAAEKVAIMIIIRCTLTCRAPVFLLLVAQCSMEKAERSCSALFQVWTRPLSRFRSSARPLPSSAATRSPMHALGMMGITTRTAVLLDLALALAPWRRTSIISHMRRRRRCASARACNCAMRLAPWGAGVRGVDTIGIRCSPACRALRKRRDLWARLIAPQSPRIVLYSQLAASGLADGRR